MHQYRFTRESELCRGDDIGEMLLWQASLLYHRRDAIMASLGYTQPRHSGRTGGHEDLKLKPQMAMMVVQKWTSFMSK